MTYAVYAASLASGLAITPIVVHALGTTAYGLWAFIGAVTVYLGLLDFGVGPSIIRFGAVQRGRRTPEETSELASAGLVLYGAIGLLSVAAGAGLAWLVPVLVDLPDDLVWPARIAILLVVAGIAARFPLGLFGNLLVAQQRYDVVNLGNLLSVGLYAGLVVAIFRGDGGIVLLSALALAATVFRLAFPLAWLSRELPSLRIRRRLVTRARLRELISFSWNNFLIHIASKVVFSTDVIVVGVLLGPEAAAFYAIPAKLFQLAFQVGVAGTNLLFPAFAELEGAGETDRQRAFLLTGLRGGMCVMLLFALPLVLVPDLFIRAWIGEGFGPSTWVMVLLGFTLLLHQPGQVLSQYLIARGQNRALAHAVLAAAGANVVLSIVLAETVGLWGVALSTLVTDVAAMAVLVPRLVLRAAGLSARELAWALVRPVLTAVPLAVLLLVLVARLYDPDTLASLVPLGVAWVAAFAPIAWLLGLSARERSGLLRELARFRRPADVTPEAA
jgi:O-antigen/teichoic acid export membrane protein